MPHWNYFINIINIIGALDPPISRTAKTIRSRNAVIAAAEVSKIYTIINSRFGHALHASGFWAFLAKRSWCFPFRRRSSPDFLDRLSRIGLHINFPGLTAIPFQVYA